MTEKYTWCRGYVDGYNDKAKKDNSVYKKFFKQGVDNGYKQNAYEDGKDYEYNYLYQIKDHHKLVSANYPIIFFDDGTWSRLC